MVLLLSSGKISALGSEFWVKSIPKEEKLPAFDKNDALFSKGSDSKAENSPLPHTLSMAPELELGILALESDEIV